MMSSLMPSEKYFCSGSPLALTKGSTAMVGRSDGEPARRADGVSAAGAPGSGRIRTSPTKRTPRRGTVRISRCSSPLSPTARRAALMRLTRVESETTRPPHTEAMRSSLATTRLRFSTRWTSTSNTCGSIATGVAP